MWLPRVVLTAAVITQLVGALNTHTPRTTLRRSSAAVSRARPRLALLEAELLPFGTLPAQSPAAATGGFSLFSWNCLLPNSEDNWWCEKMYQPHVPMEARQWPHRQQLIRDRILLADADIVCIQEAAGDTFDADFAFMREQGYESVLHRKFRFRCATFYRPQAFTLQSVAHEDRALVTAFSSAASEERVLFLANVHLSGGASPERRLRQMHGVTERMRKWSAAAQQKKSAPKGRKGSAARRAQEEAEASGSDAAAPPPASPCVLIAGDFNSDGNTAVRRLLVEGGVAPEWREPQYREVELTSKLRSHGLGPLEDAAEVAYGQNVCDGDWGDWGARTSFARYRARRPATYVVPSLSSVFLARPNGATSTHRQQVVADHAMLARLSSSSSSSSSSRPPPSPSRPSQQLQPPSSPPPAPQPAPPPPAPPPRGLSAEDRAVCEATEAAPSLVAACRVVFDAIDADRGGSLSIAELTAALEKLSVSDADVDAMLCAADADDDGEIDFGEFVAIVRADGGSGGGSVWWAEFLRALRGGSGGDGGGGGDGDGAGGGASSDEQQQPELVRLETEADVERLIDRFTPAFRAALDALFDRLASAATPAARETAAPTPPFLTAQCRAASGLSRPSGGEEEGEEAGEEAGEGAIGEGAIGEGAALAWLELVNRELGRGGTYRGVVAAFEESASRLGGRRELTRRAWHGVFARELAEGKWWQVAYDLDVSGVAVEDFECAVGDDATYGAVAQRRPAPGGEGEGDSAAGTDGERRARMPREVRAPRRHYEAWLDYVYYSSRGLRLVGYQESLEEEQARLIYQEGDALPNAWHPSDHLPVGCVFEWV